VILLNDDVEIVYRGHIEGSSAQRAHVMTMLSHILDTRIKFGERFRPFAPSILEAAANGRGLCFCSLLVLGILRHRVILRHPPPSGRVSWFELRWMMTRFPTFYQTQDTTSRSPPTPDLDVSAARLQ